jgi:hypothetical protein
MGRHCIPAREVSGKMAEQHVLYSRLARPIGGHQSGIEEAAGKRGEHVFPGGQFEQPVQDAGGEESRPERRQVSRIEVEGQTFAENKRERHDGHSWVGYIEAP